MKKERLNQALELSKMADSHYLAYQIKKRSQVFFDDESNKVLIAYCVAAFVRLPVFLNLRLLNTLDSLNRLFLH